MKTQKTILLILLISIFSMLAACGNPAESLTATEYLSLGEKYLLELDYEQAVVQFLAVIEIEPMNPRGYAGAAEAYVGLGRIDVAFNSVMEDLLTTYDISQGYHEFSEIWRMEVEWAYQNIIQLAPAEERAKYESAYTQWLNTYETELTASLDAYESTGGTIDSINRGSISLGFFKESAKRAYRILYRYDSQYSYGADSMVDNLFIYSRDMPDSLVEDM